MKGLLLAGGRGIGRGGGSFYIHARGRLRLGMRLPDRLGRIYARLYSAFGAGAFDLEGAREALGSGERGARLALSELRRAGRLASFEGARGGLRYRLLDPSLVKFALDNGLSLARFVGEGAYARLLLLFAKGLLERYGDRILSIVLYGSVARGDASRESDLDLLLIVDGLPKSYSERVGELVSLEMDGSILEELKLLRKEGYFTDLSYLALTPDEAREFRPIFLDILADGIPLLDRGSFFDNLSRAYIERLASLGAKRLRSSNGDWYWILKPDIEFGEEIRI